MKESIIKKKSYEFAIEVVRLFLYLSKNKNEYVLSKQILRSGTSIGANVEEALGGQSSKDFLSKISIAYKEARETNYWLRLLKDTNIISEDIFNKINNPLQEILKILGKIQITMKQKLVTRNS